VYLTHRCGDVHRCASFSVFSAFTAISFSCSFVLYSPALDFRNRVRMVAMATGDLPGLLVS
jgi:hypothetical protein